MKIYLLFYVLLLVIAGVFIPSLAVRAEGVWSSGWSSFVTDIDSNSSVCAPTEIELELTVRELGTERPITKTEGAVNFTVVHYNSGGLIGSQIATGDLPTPQRLCMNPDYDIVSVLATSQNDHTFFTGRSFVDSRFQPPVLIPSDLPRGKVVRMTVWMLPNTQSIEHEVLSPLWGIATTTDPSFEIKLNSFPRTYGATGLSYLNLFIYDITPGRNSSQKTQDINIHATQNGSEGVYRIPPQSLPDGVYHWFYNFQLNDSHSTGGMNLTNTLASGLGWTGRFTLDRTAPTFTSEPTHSPASPNSSQTVTIASEVSDELSGVSEITLLVDGNVSNSCTFANSATTKCETVVGPFQENSTHSYISVAKDALGNVATSSVYSFTVGTAPSVPATDKYHSGWSDFVTEVVADDTSCGSGQSKLVVDIREKGTNNPISNATTNYAALDFGRGYTSYGTVVGPATPEFCFATDIHNYIALDIKSSSYYNYAVWKTFAYLWNRTGPNIVPGIPSGKKFKMTVWLTPRTQPEDVTPVFPVNGIAVSANPEYVIDINSFPSVYGATGISSLNLLVINQSPTGEWAPMGAFKKTGGVGRYTIPPQKIYGYKDFDDGIYTWRIYTKLNDSHSNGGITFTNTMDGSDMVMETFILDRVAPTFTAAPSHSPAKPHSSDRVSVSTTVGDTFAGVRSIKIFIDDILSKTCSFADTNSASCTSVSGPYSELTEHTYSAVAVDAAGNTATSSEGVFKVGTDGYDSTISVVPSPLSYGDQAHVSWSTDNPGNCSVTSIPSGDFWSGATGGETTSPLSADTTYVLSCDGALQASYLLRVNPDVEIHASLPVVKSGSEVTVSWDTKGNKESVCTLSGGGLSNSLFNGTGKGTATITVDNATLLKLTCGQKSDTEMVSIVPLSWES